MRISDTSECIETNNNCNESELDRGKKNTYQLASEKYL